LKEPTTNQGKVVAVSGDSLVLATHKGSLSMKKNANDLTNYRTGDSVILANGVVVGRRLRTPTVYVV
jgi:hypothetical protein